MSWPDDNTTSGSQREFWTGVNYSLKSLKAQKLNWFTCLKYPEIQFYYILGFKK